MLVKADLHIHSCLSPCGRLEMSPALIARLGRQAGLNMMALTDHNCARNSPAFAQACEREGITAVFGVEATTVEEAHILVLFESLHDAMEFGELMLAALLEFPTTPRRFGDQVFVDYDETILGEVEKSLLAATTLSLEQITALGLEREALVIPAHINRPSFSVPSQLGFIPPLPFTALETAKEPLAGQWSFGGRDVPSDGTPGAIALITGSDAHEPRALGLRHIEFEAQRADFPSLREALRNNRLARRYRQQG